MQIREQGRQVQLIRSPYDATKKRCVQKVVHTFPQSNVGYGSAIDEFLSADQLADLSDDEKKTVSDWLKARADKKAADRRESAISFADGSIGRVADAISSDGVSAEQAARIWAAIDKLSKALKKASYPKSAMKASAAPVAQAGQADAAQQDLLS